MISLMSIVVGLNVGVRADAPTDANIHVEERVSESISERSKAPEYPDTTPEPVVAAAERIERFHLLPDPYHTRVQEGMNVWADQMVALTLRFGLGLADRTASVAYAHQALLTAPGVLKVVQMMMPVAALVPIVFEALRLRNVLEGHYAR